MAPPTRTGTIVGMESVRLGWGSSESARRTLVAAALALGATVLGCNSPAPEGDCASPPPSTSPIIVYIDGTPSNVPASAFTVTAVGSKGDTPSLQGESELGGDDFQGTGQTDETYVVTVIYQGTTIFEGNVGIGVNGCDFGVHVLYFENDGGIVLDAAVGPAAT